MLEYPYPEHTNLLSNNGEAIYRGCLFSETEAQAYFEFLEKHILWQKEKVVIAGKEIQMQRMVAWYGDKAYRYSYSGQTKMALAWTHELLKLKTIVEQGCQETYNACLLNYYPDGNSGMGWHSDNEPELVKASSIASLSFGAARKFSLKPISGGPTVSLILQNGSLLEMKGATQNYWLHSLPKSKKIAEPRINLTFRSMSDQSF